MATVQPLMLPQPSILKAPCEYHSSHYSCPLISWPMGSLGDAASPELGGFRPKRVPKARAKRMVAFLLAVLAVLALLTHPQTRLLLFPQRYYLGPSASPDVYTYDLSYAKGTERGWHRGERILFLVPLRDAESHMDMFFNHMNTLSYPHNLIDLAFLLSDTKDRTLEILEEKLAALQGHPDASQRFGTINIYKRDFGQAIGQGFSDRHGFDAQGPRRKLMARARNWLLSVALEPYHSWVYWRDADVETIPRSILEDLMKHNKEVIVPNVWRPLPDWLGYEQPYDLNSWQESETSLSLAESLDEDAVVVEGYAEYATWRAHLAYLRDPNGDVNVEMELDGIGGVSILAKASVFRQGANFPAYSYKRHAETEGFGKVCRDMGFAVVGLPHYTIWHIYEPSSDDLKHMEWMAREEERISMENALKEERDRVYEQGFENVWEYWKRERERVLNDF